ncbi:MAG: GlsB/YeaQ/YmgE family stress response membrane protein [Actinobacteria bacterium]|nr:GlsB/YeaQ/YmgE family stress response membrane protein [Actinomycetota bacterium]
MGILEYIVVGLIVGALARLLMPGKDPIGIMATIAIGVLGAVAGGYIWRATFGDSGGVEWIGSILVAMALLFVYRQMTYGKTVSRRQGP